jgi:hypothetical protein
MMMTKENLGRWLVVGFLSGAVSVLACHQVIAALLHAIGITPRVPYSMQPTHPLGVAQVWSLVFWGGVWGGLLAAALRRYADGALVIAATIFGAILPSLVAWTVVAALKGQPLFAGGAYKALAVGLLVNAAWGLGTGTGLALFGRRGRLKMRAA